MGLFIKYTFTWFFDKNPALEVSQASERLMESFLRRSDITAIANKTGSLPVTDAVNRYAAVLRESCANHPGVPTGIILRGVRGSKQQEAQVNIGVDWVLFPRLELKTYTGREPSLKFRSPAKLVASGAAHVYWGLYGGCGSQTYLYQYLKAQRLRSKLQQPPASQKWGQYAPLQIACREALETLKLRRISLMGRGRFERACDRKLMEFLGKGKLLRLLEKLSISEADWFGLP
jgi:hypothetical protein